MDGELTGVANNRTEQFAEALTKLENDGELEEFLGLFSDEAELSRPEKREHVAGLSAARDFWQDYLAVFAEIHSDFTRITDAKVGVLEWVGTGSLQGGHPVSYAGVSLLDFDDDNKIVRFASYYDTQAFTPPTADQQAG